MQIHPLLLSNSRAALILYVSLKVAWQWMSPLNLSFSLLLIWKSGARLTVWWFIFSTGAEGQRHQWRKGKNSLFQHSAACWVRNVKVKCQKGKLCHSSLSKMERHDGCRHRGRKEKKRFYGGIKHAEPFPNETTGNMDVTGDDNAHLYALFKEGASPLQLWN